MARVKLKRFAGKKGDTASNIIEMLRALDPTLHVVDAEGNALVGAPHPSHIQKYPIEFEGEILGWVMGGKQAAALAALLAELVSRLIGFCASIFTARSFFFGPRFLLPSVAPATHALFTGVWAIGWFVVSLIVAALLGALGAFLYRAFNRR